MSRLTGPIGLLFGLVAAGCSRGSAGVVGSDRADGLAATSPASPLASTAGSTASPTASGAGGVALPPPTPPVFSAPIGASFAHQQLVVAGLVAAEGVVRVMGLAAGRVAWSVDALRGAAWVADCELRVQPAGDGVALVWRGILAGKAGATLVVLGPHGEPRGEPIVVGAGSCATAEGVAWIVPHLGGGVQVRARRFDEPGARDVAMLASDRAPTLLCGEHQAFVLGEGDDDLTATAFSPAGAAARPAAVAIRDSDFGDDDEREHEAFTLGDDLGIVRIGSSGTIAVREMAEGHASPWRRLKHAIPEDADVVAVDGDESATSVVYTREATDACPGGESGQAVRALRIDRKTNVESPLALAPADCDGAPGSFWIASAPGEQAAPVVAWSRRRTKPASSVAPIDSLEYRVLGGDRPREGRVAVEADALVDAGCDESACFAAALVRGADNDGGRPESIVALPYP
jgi:hypothetical protein